MRKLFRGTAALATSVVAVIALSAAVEAKPVGAWAGCRAVCIYPQNQNPAVKPTHVFHRYGAHNLSNQFGHHWVLNNQYGGATANLCTRTGGAGCGSPIAAKTGVYADLTPVNSIRLNR
ncbi:hypothetical protein [Streptomyces virginiae]|uniref:hypothetical protein n=1 Tax=Streptomyces virginiae TaxID=1961 RepID=UPI00341C737D